MSQLGAGTRTLMLMSVLTVLLLVVGYAVGMLMNVSVYHTLTAALGFAMLLNLLTYWYADKWVLKIYKAKLVSEAEEPELHEMVGRLSANARLPKPSIAIIPSDAPNAFATGRDPSHAVVAVTKGAKSLLDKDQLEGVLGHEIAHIRNRDMLINTIAAMVAGAIAYIGMMGRWMVFTGDRRERDGGGALLALLALIFVPIAAMLVRLSISRGREYGADEEGASLSRKPLALASALLSIDRWAKRRPMPGGNPATSHMFIVNPFRGESLVEIFSTHPMTEKRVQRLEEMASTGRF